MKKPVISRARVRQDKSMNQTTSESSTIPKQRRQHAQPCPICGTSLRKHARFCAHCGHAFGIPDTQTTPGKGYNRTAQITTTPKIQTSLSDHTPDEKKPRHQIEQTTWVSRRTHQNRTPRRIRGRSTLPRGSSGQRHTHVYSRIASQSAVSSQTARQPSKRATQKASLFSGLLSSTVRVPLLALFTLTAKIRQFIGLIVTPLLALANGPEPEKLESSENQPALLPWFPRVVLLSTLGLLIVAIAYNFARQGQANAELCFWLGLSLIFCPTLVRLLYPRPSRWERITLLCVVALLLYLTRIELSPLYFSGYDELLHWRTANDIMNTGHLFSKNPLLPVSPYYPGLEIITSALSTLSTLTTFQAGVIIIGVASLLMALTLYLLCELLSGSARLASLATIIYMTNPHYLLFDHQFAYESLALPLATVVLFAMARYETLEKTRPWLLLCAWLLLTAVDVTHHATNFVFEGLFLLWGAVYLFLRPRPLRKSIVMPTILFGLLLTVGTLLLIGNTVIGYFSSFFTDLGSQITQSLGNNSGSSHQLFSSTGGMTTPLWERMVSLAAVGLITLAIPFLLLCFWKRYRQNTLAWVFALIVVFYPALQILHLTSSGAEMSDRVSAFAFIALSFLAAVAIAQFWPLKTLRWPHAALISSGVLLLFMGGIVLGAGTPVTFLPGPYAVSANMRSIEPEGIQAALWTRRYLGPNNRMYTDRINQLLMSDYGEQYIVTKLSDNIDVTDLFFSPNMDSYEIAPLREGDIHYLVVDMRLSTGLPQDGYYFEAGEPSTGTTPLNPRFLSKFATVPQVNRLFDSGDIAIYDTGGLLTHT